ncbi:hypothetical protein [Bacillus suaedae]|uniref:Uncharacterized protein n=1 Tax=Halalkalibacter suaedae TaxID=2822140 RepID=A0A941APW0_9BACI|nr:hypothetical protein [Bacillus suaedae]MBP3951942.1 hypothetical protein [Bacillus suaedae]
MTRMLPRTLPIVYGFAYISLEKDDSFGFESHPFWLEQTSHWSKVAALYRRYMCI